MPLAGGTPDLPGSAPSEFGDIPFHRVIVRTHVFELWTCNKIMCASGPQLCERVFVTVLCCVSGAHGPHTAVRVTDTIAVLGHVPYRPQNGPQRPLSFRYFDRVTAGNRLDPDRTAERAACGVWPGRYATLGSRLT